MVNKNPSAIALIVSRFGRFPMAVRKANLFLWTSWTSHCLYVYFLFSRHAEQFPTKILVQQIAIGAILCMFFIKVKKWARILSIFFNLTAAMMYLLISFLHFTSNPSLTFFSAINFSLFSISIYYLLIKETSVFFKE
jgi:hypothetical protein